MFKSRQGTNHKRQISKGKGITHVGLQIFFPGRLENTPRGLPGDSHYRSNLSAHTATQMAALLLPCFLFLEALKDVSSFIGHLALHSF